MRGKLFLWSLLSGVLLSAGWPDWGFQFLLFCAWIPLLMVQNTVQTDNRLRAWHLFVYAYLSFLTWNILCTWWVWNASAGGAAMAILVNSLMMTLTFLVYHKLRQRLPSRFGVFAIIPVWICFEFLHLDWDLTWPWLTLGNAFAGTFHWIQWYEFTGVFGGSLWVLLVNVIIFEIYMNRNTSLRSPKLRLLYSGSAAALLFFPILISWIIFLRLDPNAPELKRTSVVIVQPNLDPYNEKFNGDFRTHLRNMLDQANSGIDSTTNYVVMPETALTEGISEHAFKASYSYREIMKFLADHPQLLFITGAETSRFYEAGETPSATARSIEGMTSKYDNYNTALQFDSSGNFVQYHKSKLVPGVEKMPFPALLKPLEKLAINLGGTVGSLGVQDERTVFFDKTKTTGVAPVICYESIYGEYVGEYIRNGADFIFIITNDGWWGNTPGYRQHLLYGRLRAIETRKAIARSANTGTSCFIDITGEISQPTAWWQPAMIKGTIASQKENTFYTRYGDYIARFMLWLTGGIFLYAVWRSIARRIKKT